MDSFVLYTDQKEVVRKLTDEQAGKLLKGLYYYAETEEFPKLDITLDLVITSFVTTINRDKQKYDRRCETSAINGRLGGRPKKPNENLTKPKKADSDSVSDSEYDNESSNEDIKEKINKKKKFVKPTVEEVTEYCKDRGNRIDSQRFIDYYEANGWMVGRNHMKDWKAAVRTWEKNDGSFSSKSRKEERIPVWLDKDIKSDVATSEEQEEMKKMLEEASR